MILTERRGYVNISIFLKSLNKRTSKQISFDIVTEDSNISVSGKLRKYGEEYWFVKGKKKFVIEKEKVGNIWSWKGRRDEYQVTFMESDNTIFEIRIPTDAEIHLDEPKKS